MAQATPTRRRDAQRTRRSGSAAGRVAGLREPAQSDPRAARDEAWDFALKSEL